jgi:hypothetical protein
MEPPARRPRTTRVPYLIMSAVKSRKVWQLRVTRRFTEAQALPDSWVGTLA